jgi:hypothetical protein
LAQKIGKGALPICPNSGKARRKARRKVAARPEAQNPISRRTLPISVNYSLELDFFGKTVKIRGMSVESIAVRAADKELRAQIQQVAGDNFGFQGLSKNADADAVSAFNNALGGQGEFNANGLAGDLTRAANTFGGLGSQVPPGVVDAIRANATRVPGVMESMGNQVLGAVGTGAEGKISDLFSSIRRNLNETGQVLTRLSKQDNLSQQDLLLIQFQISKMSISLDVASKVGDKGSQALQTLFRDK